MLTNFYSKQVVAEPIDEIVINKKVISSHTKLVKCSETMKIVSFLSKPHRDIIFHLFKNSGVIYSKKELKCIGWQGKKVSNSSVLVAISEIRQVIGDRSIMTVTGEGYMYVG